MKRVSIVRLHRRNPNGTATLCGLPMGPILELTKKQDGALIDAPRCPSCENAEPKKGD